MAATTKPFYDSIFWVEVDKIRPNPYQPRRDFDEARLRELADSVRQYGILQPLVVTRHEIESPDGSIRVEYELIAGERRWRAAKMAGLTLVPVVIRSQEESDKMKLELAIIENLQREDLNPVERALAFKKLQEHGYNNAEIARKVGKSREYVSNTLRILNLPEPILDALRKGLISEGFTRPLLMLNDRPEEQRTLFEEILERKLTVRETERIARRIAEDKVRKPMPPEVSAVEKTLAKALGTRVIINPRAEGNGGKIVIDYFSEDDLKVILQKLNALAASGATRASLPTAAQPPAAQPAAHPPATEPAHLAAAGATALTAGTMSAHDQPASPPATARQPDESSVPASVPSPSSSPTGGDPTQPSDTRRDGELPATPPQEAQPIARTETPLPAPTHAASSPAALSEPSPAAPQTPPSSPSPRPPQEAAPEAPASFPATQAEDGMPLEREDASPQELREAWEEDDGDLYAVRNFTI